MSLVIVRTGSKAILNTIFGSQTKTTAFTLDLFVATPTVAVDPGVATSKSYIFTNLTLATGGGYASKTLSLATATIGTDAKIHTISWPRVTFAFTGPLTNAAAVIPPATVAAIPPIIGYAVSDAAGTLIFMEYFTRYTPAASMNLAVDIGFKLGNMATGGSIQGWEPIG